MKYFIYLIFVFLLSLYSFSQEDNLVVLHKNYTDNHLNFSGDGQVQTCNEFLDSTLKVFVTDINGNPLPNHLLKFEIIGTPDDAKSYKLKSEYVNTDSLGIARNKMLIGNISGEYRILIKSVESPKSNVLVYSVYGRSKNWVSFLLIGLIGGLAIFLYGIDLMSKGMQASAGDRMRDLIDKLTRNRFLALFSGIIITVMLQSSSAASVLLVGFVQAGLMQFAQSLGILLGAGIGTTITAQLIAMNISDYSLLIIAIGFLVMTVSRNIKQNNIGKAILGGGLLFFGMLLMSQTMAPLRSYDGFINFLIKLENPIMGILVGFIFTALIQSSAAFIGIMITLASQGFISLEASIPLVLGTNLGTGITAILASINSSRDAKKVAFSHTLFKAIGVLIFVWWIPQFADLLRAISKIFIDNNSSDIYDPLKSLPWQIANAHTIFSVTLALVLLPFIKYIAQIIDYIFPSKNSIIDQPIFELKHINLKVNASPALAISVAKKETERMSENVQKMLILSIKPFMNKDATVLEKLQVLENKIDFLKENISKYIISVSSENSDEERFNEAFQIMYVVKELEMIADLINTNIRHQAKKWIICDADFSEKGKQELFTIHEKAMKQISRSMEVFHELNLDKALKVKSKHKKYALLAEKYEKYHYQRLIENNEKTIASSEVHLELIGLYNAIIRHASNISRIFLTWSKNPNDKDYINSNRI
jgi:phosphate:Na+ symporter